MGHYFSKTMNEFVYKCDKKKHTVEPLYTLGTKIIVLISEVSLFQGENMYLYKVGTQSSVLIECAITATCVCWSSVLLFVSLLVLAFLPQNIML